MTSSMAVVPADAGTHPKSKMDSRFRGNDGGAAGMTEAAGFRLSPE
jgi:hypothetical protein